MPHEPAYGDKRRQDAEAQSTSEFAKGRMPFANVRRRGMGSPEPLPTGSPQAAQVSRETGNLGQIGNEGGFT
jgi:hypothetical protein